MPNTNEQLLIENESLRTRLQEMQDVLDAIQNGEADAIVVSGDNGEQVYTISSAETPYRTFIEEMSEGAVTLARDGTILYCNQRFAKIVDTPYVRVIGSSIKHFIAPDDNYIFDSFLARLSHEERDVIIVSLTNTLYLRLSIYALPPYLQGDNYILIATDISDLKRREQELTGIIEKLADHIRALRGLRIGNICDMIDEIGRKNKLEAANQKLLKEIEKLNLLVESLKQEQQMIST